MVVVSDTSPLISLAHIEKLDLLETLYGEVFIGETVWREFSTYIAPFDIFQAQKFAGKVRNLTNKNIFAGLMDPGEAEAAALYQELNADYLIIDDRTARRIAEAHGIRCRGTLGILQEAKECALIDLLRPLFARLLEYNRYYKPALLNAILAENGEPPLD